MTRLIVPILALMLSACAIQPNGIADPIGVGGAFDRCFGPNYIRPEKRVFPEWFSMFGLAFACR